MPVIAIKYEGKIYQREIARKQEFYVMYSKGVEYRFGKDIHRLGSYKGWHIVNQKTLPDFMMPLIAEELEKVNNSG